MKKKSLTLMMNGPRSPGQGLALMVLYDFRHQRLLLIVLLDPSGVREVQVDPLIFLGVCPVCPIKNICEPATIITTAKF